MPEQPQAEQPARASSLSPSPIATTYEVELGTRVAAYLVGAIIICKPIATGPGSESTTLTWDLEFTIAYQCGHVASCHFKDVQESFSSTKILPFPLHFSHGS